jgi:hypothetical protein
MGAGCAEASAVPKKVYVRGVGYVRAGSWSTKRFYEKWKLTMKQLDDAHELMLMRIRYLFLEDITGLPEYDQELARTLRECDEDHVISQIELLRDYCDSLLKEIPKARRTEERVKALENTTGRTPEEAEAFKAKAATIRAEIQRKG